MSTGFLITARLKSTRLKRKILLDLCGRTVLDRVIDRCMATRGIDGVVLCTSTVSEDAELEAVAHAHGIGFYAGSPDDVLERNYRAAEEFNHDAILSITADNPLFSIQGAEQLAECCRECNCDFGFLKGLPIGCMPYFLRRDALQIALAMKAKSNTEIWGPFVRRDDFFHIADFQIANSPFDESYRLTCDYPQDYELFKFLYALPDVGGIPVLMNVLKYLELHPHVWDINAGCVQAQTSDDDLDDINSCFDQHMKMGRQLAAGLGIQIAPGYTCRQIEL